MISIEDLANENYERYKGAKGANHNLKKESYILKMHKDLHTGALERETGLSSFKINRLLQHYCLKARELSREETNEYVRLRKILKIEELDEEKKQMIIDFLPTEPIYDVAHCFEINPLSLIEWCKHKGLRYIPSAKNKKQKSVALEEIRRKKISDSLRIFSDDEEEYIEELRTQLIPKEIAKRVNARFNKNFREQQIISYFIHKNELFVSRRLSPERKAIINDMLYDGITDINTVYNKCLVTRDILTDYINDNKEAFKQMKDIKKEIAIRKIEEGIAASKAKGKKMGRPKIELPENFEEEYIKWKEEKQTAAETMENTGLKRGKFYISVKEYESSNKEAHVFEKEEHNKIKHEVYQKTQEQKDIQVATLLKFDRAVDEIIKYSYNHKYLNKDVVYYILETNGFEEMMKEMERVRQNYARNN